MSYTAHAAAGRLVYFHQRLKRFCCLLSMYIRFLSWVHLPHRGCTNSEREGSWRVSLPQNDAITDPSRGVLFGCIVKSSDRCGASPCAEYARCLSLSQGSIEASAVVLLMGLAWLGAILCAQTFAEGGRGPKRGRLALRQARQTLLRPFSREARW